MLASLFCRICLVRVIHLLGKPYCLIRFALPYILGIVEMNDPLIEEHVHLVTKKNKIFSHTKNCQINKITNRMRISDDFFIKKLCFRIRLINIKYIISSISYCFKIVWFQTTSLTDASCLSKLLFCRQQSV